MEAIFNGQIWKLLSEEGFIDLTFNLVTELYVVGYQTRQTLLLCLQNLHKAQSVQKIM